MFLKIKAFFMALIMSICSLFGLNVTKKYHMAIPENFGTYTEKEVEIVDNADYYVATDGNDANCGDFEHPFATIERAKEAVETKKAVDKDCITVAIKAGDYRVSSLKFSSADSGSADCPIKYCAYGDGEVTLNGGVSISPSDFSHVTDKDILSRLSSDASKNVVCFDLKKLGVTAEDYGKIYAIGSYNTAEKYMGDTVGPLYCELFVNDSRMTLARYPDSGYFYTEEVVSTGQGSEDNHQTNDYWQTIVNPESDIYRINQELADRINSWKTLDDVWMFGFWMYDWADASTPIGSFDYANRTISPKYVSRYGTKTDAPYYFFNILEELDSEGEWYLDRDNGIIYLYPSADFGNSTIDLSLTSNEIICGSNVENIIFEGLTIKGTRSDAISLSGNNITIKNCLIKNVAGNAIVLKGYNNLVTECEITHTGRGGITLSGGDRTTLTNGNNRADNNLIHDWSDIYQTYQPAVTLDGCGNYCSHNEIYNSPHEAITYSGNNHIIEYNLIHDVCLLSSDAGAIYSGRRWDWYGDIVRYNCIYNIGANGYTPDGIYLDDALSGQTIYGNLLINIPKYAIHIGGGRDNDVRNNVIINPGVSGIHYDQRAIDCIEEGWFYDHSGPNGDMWKRLFESPWQTETWQKAYPQMQSFITDFSRSDEAGFAPNPAGSTITDNIILSADGKIGDISDKPYEYSTIENNAVFNIMKQNKIFTDPINGDYSLKKNSKALKKTSSFKELPISEIGRY